MRSRWIIAGIAAALAVGGSTAYAANSHGQAVSTLARGTTLSGHQHGEAVSDLASAHAVAVHAQASADAGTTPVQARTETQTHALARQSPSSTGCASARTAFFSFLSGQRSEAMAERQAELSEDRTEGRGASGDAAEDQAEMVKDQAEDQAEAAAFKAAVSKVVAACGERAAEPEESEAAAEAAD